MDKGLSVPYQEHIARLEAITPLLLAVHGVLILSILGGQPFAWGLLILTVLLGTTSFLRIWPQANLTLLRAVGLLCISILLLFTTGQESSFFLAWLFVIVSIYPIVLKAPFRVILPFVIACGYLSMLLFPSLQLPTVVIWTRALLMLYIGLLTQKLGSIIGRHTAEEEALIQQASDGIFISDLDGNLIRVNEIGCRMLGYQQAELLQKNVREIIAVSPDSTPLQFAQLRSGQLVHSERALLRKDGARLPVEISVKMVDGNRLQGIVRDISERKVAEQNLQNARNFLQATINSLSAHIAILDENGTILNVNSAWQKFGRENNLKMIKDGIGSNYLAICDAAAKQGVEDAVLMARAIREMLAGEIKSAQIEYPCHSPTVQRWFVAYLTSFFEAGATYVVVAHENITGRKLAENRLRESEKRLNAVIESAMDAIITIDESQQIVLFNPAAEIMFECPAAEAIGSPIDRFIPERFHEAHREHIHAFSKTGITSRAMDNLGVIYGQRDRDGEFPIEASISQIEVEGRKLYTVILRDVTERTQIEAERQATLHLLQRIGDNFPHSYLSVVNRDMTVGFTAGQEFKTRGLDPNQFIGLQVKDVYGVYGEEILNLVTDKFLKTFNGEPQAFELFVDGEYQSYNTVPLGENGAINQILSVAENITGRKQIEQALEDREKYYRALIENSTEAVIVLGGDSRVLYQSPASFKLLNISTEEFQNRNVFEIVHPDDLPQALKLFSQLADDPGKPISGQVRFQHPDGNWHWMEAIGNNLLAEPSVQGIVVNFRDITDRKYYENEMARHAGNMSVLSELSQQIHTILDLDQIYQQAHVTTQKLMPCDAFVVAILHADRQEIEAVYLWSEDKRLPNQRYPVGQGLTDFVISSSRPLRVENWNRSYTRENKEAALGDLNQDTVSTLAVPLMNTKGICFGMVSTQSYAPYVYSVGEEQLLITLAAHVAQAIENSRLIMELQEELSERKRAEAMIKRQVQKLEGLHQVDLAITSGLEMKLGLELILDQLVLLLNVDAAVILLLEPQLHLLRYVTGRGFQSVALQHTELKLGQGHAGRAAFERQPVHIPDLRKVSDDSSHSLSLTREGFISYYAIPLIIKGQVKGVLEIFHRAPLQLDDEWLEFAETLASQAAILVEDTEMFNNLQRLNFELFAAYDATIEGWSRALDLRDKETEGHTQRVTELTLSLAQAMGISDDELIHIRRGALLHDIGKMGVPDNILLKAGELTDEEWEQMHQHPTLAREMLSDIRYLKPALDIPYCHHEKWDGSGYPSGLKGEVIPLAARIFAIVDVWDALTSNRPYRKAWSKDRTLKFIKEQSGRHFDPQVVEAFLNLINETMENT